MASDFTKRHFIVETSKVKSTLVGHMYSIKDTVNNMDNGELVLIGDLIAGEREIYEVKTPAVTDKGVVLVNTPALIYEQYTTLQGAEYNFYNKAGDVARAQELGRDDVYGISKEAFTPIDEVAGLVPNNYVVNDGARKYKEVETLAGTEGFVAKILFTRTFGIGDTRVYIRVVQN